ncbi:MAG: ribosome maturation factor RimP [Gammaproteobacteria bacterium]|nr:ribosome maturation factor RimP [Gammaproteobacteria bacterium]MYF38319.1 ribosome maturation factor RimP [Gammaproteobacteria bacterium]
MSSRNTNIEELLSATIEAMGYEIWGVDYTIFKSRVNLCVYIDSDKGITVDDCAEVSNQIEGVLDVEAQFPQNMTLQVSSPGLDRILFKPRQFASRVGTLIDVRLSWPVEGRTHVRGRLNSCNADSFLVEMDEQEFEIRFEQVRRARVVPEFN